MIGASLVLWGVHFLVLRGIREAAFVNLVTTIAKIVPLILFIVITAVAFRLDVFTADFWGRGNPELGSVMQQVRNMMLVTVWVFIGIEGANVFGAAPSAVATSAAPRSSASIACSRCWCW